MKYVEPLWMALLLLAALDACQKPNETAVTRPKAGDTYELGTVLPELRSIQHDTARIILYPHARWFYLDMRTMGSQDYLTLIQAAAQSGRPVKARIFKRPTNEHGEGIAQIYE